MIPTYVLVSSYCRISYLRLHHQATSPTQNFNQQSDCKIKVVGFAAPWWPYPYTVSVVQHGWGIWKSSACSTKGLLASLKICSGILPEQDSKCWHGGCTAGMFPSSFSSWQCNRSFYGHCICVMNMLALLLSTKRWSWFNMCPTFLYLKVTAIHHSSKMVYRAQDNDTLHQASSKHSIALYYWSTAPSARVTKSDIAIFLTRRAKALYWAYCSISMYSTAWTC